MATDDGTTQGLRDILSDLSGHRYLTAGFHSQMGYFRDDAPLYQLVLDDKQQQELDKLWKDLDLITNAPVRQYQQFLWSERTDSSYLLGHEFETFRPEDNAVVSEARIKELSDLYIAKAKSLDNEDQVVQVAQDYFVQQNAKIRALEQAQKDAEPHHLDSLVNFAERAFRRPLSNAERDDILAFYHKLRAQDISHEDAIRFSVISVLMSPSFCFRMNLPNRAQTAGPGRAAVDGLRTGQPAELFPLGQHARRGIARPRRRRRPPSARGAGRPGASHVAGPAASAAWRRSLAATGSTSAASRSTTRWIATTSPASPTICARPCFRSRFASSLMWSNRNSSVLDFVYGDYTFVNPILAKHYGMPAPAGAADQWVRVDDAQKYQRGGLLPMAAFLTKNAPGLRTSPVKRGVWVVTKLLGEVIPSPPPNVPAIPSDESKLGNLTLRETLARHHADPNCASCHDKFDSFGLVFEGYGPIGELRTLDLGNRPVETDATFPDGTQETGLDGLRDYLHTKVQDEFLDNLSRKLLVYALGRSLQASDEPLIADMHQKLSANGYRFDTLVEGIITSPQFLMKRSAPAS